MTTAVVDLATTLVAQLTRAGLTAGATENGLAVAVLTYGRHTVVWMPDPEAPGTGYLWGARFEHAMPADAAPELVAAEIVATPW